MIHVTVIQWRQAQEKNYSLMYTKMHRETKFLKSMQMDVVHLIPLGPLLQFRVFQMVELKRGQ